MQKPNMTRRILDVLPLGNSLKGIPQDEQIQYKAAGQCIFGFRSLV